MMDIELRYSLCYMSPYGHQYCVLRQLQLYFHYTVSASVWLSHMNIFLVLTFAQVANNHTNIQFVFVLVFPLVYSYSIW